MGLGKFEKRLHAALQGYAIALLSPVCAYGFKRLRKCLDSTRSRSRPVIEFHARSRRTGYWKRFTLPRAASLRSKAGRT